MKKVTKQAMAIVLCMGLLAGCSQQPQPQEAASSQTETVDNSALVTKDARSIGLEGVDNARQLGGYQTKDGRTIKDGVLLRTGALADATDADIQRLTDTFGLTEVIDFRTSDEKASAPDPEMTGVTNVPISIIAEDSATAGMASTAAGQSDPMAALYEYAKSGAAENMYVDIVTSEYSQQGYVQFFDELLNHDDGAILWHCTGGKDRAGLATYFLLYALGVDEDTILKDFDLSNDFYQENVEATVAKCKEQGFTDEELEGIKALVGVSPEYLKKALDAIDEQYGSMDDYLHNQLQLSDDDIKTLQDKYLEG